MNYNQGGNGFKNHLNYTCSDVIKKADHPRATAPTPTAYTDEPNVFKFLPDVHKYCLFPVTCWNFNILSHSDTIYKILVVFP